MLAKNELLQGRYRIIRQLGHGGMGAVYEASDDRLGSAVALKEIIIDLDKVPTVKQRELFMRAFEREARLLANLHHEVFPRVMDYFSEGNRQFLIMELIAGDDLSELLNKRKAPFAINEALRCADHLLDALDYLHTQTPPIYHRDIKPQNLKVNFRGRIKLLDFGIARIVDQSASTMTNQTFVGATLDYAPIEQVLPAITPTFREFIILKHSEKALAVLSQNTDARCDIYAVGATFYHLLTNRAPVDAAKRTLEIWEGGSDPLANPSEINPEIQPPIAAWLLKALRVEREDRFSSALEMQQALQAAMEEVRNQAVVWKPPVVTEAVRNDEEKITAERLMQAAQTEKLIITDQPLLNPEQKTVSRAPDSQTQSFDTEPLTKPPLFESAATESIPLEVADTGSSHDAPKSKQTGSFYFDQKLVEQQQKPQAAPAPAPLFETRQAVKSGFNFIWLVPIFAFGLLAAIAGVGSLVWLNASNFTEEIRPASNTTTSFPTATPAVSPVSPVKLTPTPMPTVAQTENTPAASVEKPKPAVVEKTPPPQNPIRTPATQKPPKPGKTLNLSDDCIYNGKCE